MVEKAIVLRKLAELRRYVADVRVRVQPILRGGPSRHLTIHVPLCIFLDVKRRTSSSRLKAKLGQYMRAVRAGEEIVVTDRDQPVARLVPYRERVEEAREVLEVSLPRDPGAPPLSRVEVHPIRYRGRSTTDLLEEDRKRR